MKSRIDLKVSYKIIDDRKVICYVTPIFTRRNPFYVTGGIFYLKNPRLGTYRGCAIRNSGDANDIKMAKDIAKKKAIRAAYRGIAKKAKEAIKEEKRKIAAIDSYIAFLRDKATEITNEIIEITKEN